MQSKNRDGLILMLFFGSGATALIYEVLWSKFLSQMFGSTIYAQTVVMAAFMGGLALGNRLFGRWADRRAQPVPAYGMLEILIGLYAFLFPTLDRLTDHIFVALGTPIAAHSGWLLALKGGLSAALLLGPTILMGGTLPLLAAWLQKSSTDAGRRSARFYSVNSLGAVLGSGLAGFWLVQHYGMIATLQLTALANLIIGTTAVIIGRTPVTVAPAAPAPAEVDTLPGTLRRAGLIVALTGAISMGLEVLSARSLALIFGSSLQSFAIVLMAFILGIGLGSAWIASSRWAGRASEKMVAVLLCGAALWVTLLVFNIEHWVDLYRLIRTGLGRTEMGYFYQLVLSTGMALFILGVPAAAIGAVLPLMIRAVSAGGAPLGAKVGTLLTWNTLGAVTGTLLTGFVLMPLAGLRAAFGSLALGLAFVALLVAAQRRWRSGMLVTAGACGFALCLFFIGGEDWRNVMSAGLFRVWETKYDPQLMPLRKQHIKVRFYEDAPDATVSVEEVDGIIAPASLGLRINGKPDAGTGLDLSTQFLLANLPLMVKPEAKDVFVLGLGSGITAGAVLPYPVEKLVIAENCAPVIRAARLFGDWNRHVLDDPRTHVETEDARTVLKLHPQKYDVIITEPSNPWTVGIGSVFSREFYELAAQHLKPGGIVSQWFHVYEMNDDILKLVLRTFNSVFPYMEVWDTRNGDIVMLGSMQPWPTGPDVFRQGFAINRVRTDMMMIDIRSPEALLARQIASQRTGFAIAGPGPLQSDLYPILEYEAPEAFFMGNGTRVLEQYDERTRQLLLAPPEKNAALRTLSASDVQFIFSDFSTMNGELYGCIFGNGAGRTVPCVFQTATPTIPPGSGGTALDEAEKDFANGNFTQAGQIVTAVLQNNPADVQAGYLKRIIQREQPAQAHP